MTKKDNPLVIKLTKPVEFEGKTIKEVDLSGLENIKTPDLIEIEKQFSAEGNYAAQPETTIAFARIVAQKVSKLPLEFFDGLGGKNMYKIRNAVMTFFYEEE